MIDVTNAAVIAKTFPLPSAFEIINVIVSSVIGVLGLSAAVEGYLKNTIPIWQRIILAIGSIMLIIPEWITDIIGIAVVVVITLLNVRKCD